MEKSSQDRRWSEDSEYSEQYKKERHIPGRERTSLPAVMEKLTFHFGRKQGDGDKHIAVPSAQR